MKDLFRILLIACVASVAERFGAEVVERGESARWQRENEGRLRDLDELCGERDAAMRERDTAWRAWEDVCAATGAGWVIRSREGAT